MSVSTISYERRTEVVWADGTMHAVFGSFNSSDPKASVEVGACSPGNHLAAVSYVEDPEVLDRIAEAAAHAAATLRGDLAAKRGGDVVDRLIATPDGAVIADSLDRAREAKTS